MPEELDGLVRGTLNRAQAKIVVRHLLRGCQSCQAAVTPQAEALLRGDGQDPAHPETVAAYGVAIDRAFASALQHGRHLNRERAKVQEALDRLARDGVAGFTHFPKRLWGLAGYEALLERSWAMRHDDPAQMVALAQLAAFVSSRLSVARYGLYQVKGFECRAASELANAYRVVSRFDEARSSLKRAAELYLQCTEDTLLGGRLFEIKACIYGDQRQFETAFEALDTAHRMYSKGGAAHLAARTLIVKGLYTGVAGDPECAISLLTAGLACCDPERDPQLARAALFNVASYSLDCGRLREARRTIWQHRHLFENAGRYELLRLRWLEGRMHAGLDDLDRAERAFTEVRQGFLDAGVPYRAAIVTLDLASAWLRQGKEEQARTVVLEAAQVFLDLKIGREAMAAVLLLRTTFEFRLATSALLAQVAQFLRNEKEPPTAFITPR